jgi:hypothetical protein
LEKVIRRSRVIVIRRRQCERTKKGYRTWNAEKFNATEEHWDSPTTLVKSSGFTEPRDATRAGLASFARFTPVAILTSTSRRFNRHTSVERLVEDCFRIISAVTFFLLTFEL